MIPSNARRQRWRRSSLMRAASLLAITVIAGSCSSTADRRERVPARLVLVGDTAEVTVPDTVARGQPFQVRVVTSPAAAARRARGRKSRQRGCAR